MRSDIARNRSLPGRVGLLCEVLPLLLVYCEDIFLRKRGRCGTAYHNKCGQRPEGGPDK